MAAVVNIHAAANTKACVMKCVMVFRIAYCFVFLILSFPVSVSACKLSCRRWKSYCRFSQSLQEVSVHALIGCPPCRWVSVSLTILGL